MRLNIEGLGLLFLDHAPLNENCAIITMGGYLCFWWYLGCKRFEGLAYVDL